MHAPVECGQQALSIPINKDNFFADTCDPKFTHLQSSHWVGTYNANSTSGYPSVTLHSHISYRLFPYLLFSSHTVYQASQLASCLAGTTGWLLSPPE